MKSAIVGCFPAKNEKKTREYEQQSFPKTIRGICILFFAEYCILASTNKYTRKIEEFFRSSLANENSNDLRFEKSRDDRVFRSISIS